MLRVFSQVRPARQHNLGGARFGAAPAPAWRRQQRRVLRRSAPTWNPQNTPNPQVLPSADLSAEQAVRVQLEALQNNNQPFENHGIQTAYEFGDDIGGLEPSWYFGFRKDLYHLDHFMGQFGNQLGELINSGGFSIDEVVEGPEAAAAAVAGGPPGNAPPDAVVRARVLVRESLGGGQVAVEFRLRRRTFGSRKGAYMTSMLHKLPSQS